MIGQGLRRPGALMRILRPNLILAVLLFALRLEPADILSPQGGSVTEDRVFSFVCSDLGPDGRLDIVVPDHLDPAGIPNEEAKSESLPSTLDSAAAREAIRLLGRIGARKVWPGFDPTAWPLALFDGRQTFLLRHSNPPPEFKPLPGRPDILVFPGRYPDVAANSTREINGIRTATVLAASGVERALSATIEEVFHVFWLARHTGFRPNEMHRYKYPLNDVDLLVSVLAENEALARAVDCGSAKLAGGWLAAANGFRSKQESRLDEDIVTFQTDLEMMEGTANFAAQFALGETPGLIASRLRRARPVEDIRWRFYETGAALCWLLERFRPGWKQVLDADPALTTRALLKSGFARRGSAPPGFTNAEMAAFRARAQDSLADLTARRRSLRQELLARPGARVVVEVADGAAPLTLGRFDPINLFVLEDGEVAHPNFITLSDTRGSIELTNPGYARRSFGGTVALTAAARTHPMGRIRKMTVVGIQGQPRVDRKDGAVRVEAPGVRVDFKGAEVRTEGGTILIKVGAS